MAFYYYEIPLGGDGTLTINQKRLGSNMRHGICSIWDMFSILTVTILGNGESTHFRGDR